MATAPTTEFLRYAATQRPDYKQVCDQTREVLACFFEGEMLRRQVKQMPKEDQEKFAWRREAMLESFDNYVKEVAELYVEGVFRTKYPTRKVGDAKLSEYFNDDSDGYAEWFLSDCSPFALMLPECYVVADVPKAQGEIVSRSDKEVLQGLPYPTIKFPQYACNYGFDMEQNLSWCCFYHEEPPSVDDNAGNQKTVGERKNNVLYEIYTETHWGIFNEDGEWMPPADGEPAAPVEHLYGVLPVVRIAYRANLSAIDSARAGHAFMASITKITLGGLTAKGVLHDYQYYSLYPKLVAGEATIETMIESGMGANKPVAVPANDKVEPKYLTVPLQEFEALERIAYERIPAAAYRAARLRDRTSNRTMRGVEQSGVSKAFDMVPELGVLKAVAKFLRRADIAICRMLAKLADVSPDTVSVEYPTTFDTKSITEFTAELVEFGDAMKSTSMPTTDRGTEILAQRAWRAILQELPESEYKIIDQQIADALQAPNVPANETNETDVTEEPSVALPGGSQPSFPVVPAAGVKT